VPASSAARTSLYLKVRDRESYEFALTSVAVALRLDDGEIGEARLALGGIATKPWRARRAERLLISEPATSASFARAAAEELIPATPRRMNAFKVELAQRAMVRALETASALGGRP
jgi:xanthine dehydrogenase YagS FAD-binding subunit